MLGVYLIHTLTTIQQVSSRDKYTQINYSTLASNVKARVEEGAERILSVEGREVTVSCRIFMGATPVMVPEYRVVYDGRTFEVVTVGKHNMFGDIVYQSLNCSEVK